MIFVKLLILFAFVVCVHSGRADISGDAIFSDGFETSDSNFPAWDGHSGNLEAAGPPSPLDGDYAMSADLSDGNARYVRDDLAAAETRYRARFVFDPNSVVMADGDRHTIFAGNDPANPAFSIQFRYSGGVYQISAQFVDDSASLSSTPWFDLTDERHTLEIEWSAASAAGADNGFGLLWIDGILQAVVAGIDNDALALTAVYVGPSEGIDVGATGSEYYDSFESVRPPLRDGIFAEKSVVNQNSAGVEGVAAPGDVLTYKTAIINIGPDDAADVDLLDQISGNTDLAEGSVKTTPLAFEDAYDCYGNVGINVPSGSGLLANDADIENKLKAGPPALNTGLTVSAFDAVSAQGGAVAVNPDGSFTYDPPPEYEGADSFSYTIEDADGNKDQSRATITVSGRIWFVDNAAAAAGDGRLISPFISLSAFVASAVGATDDVIFLYEGAGAYTGGITLLNGQKLIGQGVDLAAAAGITFPAHSRALPPAAGNPVIVNAGGDGITLAQNNTIRGLTAGNALGWSFRGTSVGTLIVSDASVTGSGGAVNINGGALNAVFDEVTSTNSANEGIYLVNASGIFSANGGAITNAAGSAFKASGGDGSITYSGSITNTLNRSVEILNRTGGSVLFQSGIISDTGAGVYLNGNTGGTIGFQGAVTLNTFANDALTASSNSGAAITFSGGLDIDASGGRGINATGGGTLTVTGANNSITTTTGIPLRVENTAIGAGHLNFASVSANGAVNAVVLNNTGAGGLKIGAAGVNFGDGGVIQNITGSAFVLTDAANISLKHVRIDGTGDHAILGTRVNDLSFGAFPSLEIDHCQILNAGNGDDENALHFGDSTNPLSLGITGSLVINNTTIQNYYENALEVDNTSGQLTATISNSTIEDNNDVNGADAIFLESRGTASIAFNLTNSNFDNTEGAIAHFQGNGTSGNDINITGNTSNNGGGPDDFPAGGGIILVVDNNGALTFDIQGNNLSNLSGDGIVLVGDGNMEGRIGGANMADGNVIAGAAGDGVRIDAGGTSLAPAGIITWTLLVQNNNLSNLGDDGIQILNRDHNGSLSLTIEDNIINTAVSEGIRFFADEDSGGIIPRSSTRIVDNRLMNTSTNGFDADIELRTRDTADACFHITGNNNGAGGSPGEIALDQVNPSVFTISQSSAAALSAANNGATVNPVGTILFNGSCTNPALPSNP